MSEKLPQINDAPDYSHLFRELTNYAYRRDGEFRTGHNDIFEDHRISKIFKDVTETPSGHFTEVYDQKEIYFTASRSHHSERKSKKVPKPDNFTVKLDITTQLDKLPPQLLGQIDPELVDVYDPIDFGELHSTHSIEYGISKDDLEPEISRNLKYTLADSDNTTLYSVSESDESNKPELIDVPTESSLLLVYKPIQHEAQPDPLDRLRSNIAFDEIIDGSNVELFDNLIAARNVESTLSILALIRCLNSGSPIPNLFESIPE